MAPRQTGRRGDQRDEGSWQESVDSSQGTETKRRRAYGTTGRLDSRVPHSGMNRVQTRSPQGKQVAAATKKTKRPKDSRTAGLRDDWTTGLLEIETRFRRVEGG
jgi:hypothetical protein